jgi:uncharacterized glyoxalase superfamily protein PhnB
MLTIVLMSNQLQTTKPSPPGWPRVSSALFYEDAAAAIDWLCRAFGFEVRLRVEGDAGQIVHSELTLGDGLVMVSSVGARPDREQPLPAQSPRALGGANTQALCVYIDDVEAHCRDAAAAGATIVTPPATSDYGDDYWSDRAYRAADLEGHQWWFVQRLRTGAA